MEMPNRTTRSPALREFPIRDKIGDTYAIIEGIAVKVPRADELQLLALALGPGAAVGEGREQSENRCGQDKERYSRDSVDDGVLANANARNAGSDIVE